MSVSICVHLWLGLSLLAQDFQASVSGQVSDPDGKPVDAARVAIASLERSVTLATSTNRAGRFVALHLAPGSYTLEIEKPCFKRFVRDAVVLGASDQVEFEIRL